MEIVLTKPFRHCSELQVFSPCDDGRKLTVSWQSVAFASENAAQFRGLAEYVSADTVIRPPASMVVPVNQNFTQYFLVVAR